MQPARFKLGQLVPEDRRVCRDNFPVCIVIFGIVHLNFSKICREDWLPSASSHRAADSLGI